RRRLRGKFASFFNMSKLEGDDEIEEEKAKEVDEAVPVGEVEEAPLDFSNLSDDDGSYDYEDDENYDDDEDEDEDEDDQNLLRHEEEFAIDERTKIEFKTVEISFSHKRIKDYLVQEGGPNPVFAPPEFPKMSIGIDVNESELELALTCLAILLDDITD